MPVTALTTIAFHLNRAIESGQHDAVTVDDVRQAVRTGTIFSDLRMQLGIDGDLSLMDAATEAELLTEWQDMEITVDLVRAFGIERRGLSLLMAFLIEGIRRRAQSGSWIEAWPARLA
ncbi:hypothetical protein ACQKQD_29860 [Methylobacterium sp. NPDC080182]|uniref:hypothetical protein n=1 Tax=Methylobacterium sp. NPDC080182 TaxID=3390590 RepID=UPI003D023209